MTGEYAPPDPASRDIDDLAAGITLFRTDLALSRGLSSSHALCQLATNLASDLSQPVARLVGDLLQRGVDRMAAEGPDEEREAMALAALFWLDAPPDEDGNRVTLRRNAPKQPLDAPGGRRVLAADLLCIGLTYLPKKEPELIRKLAIHVAALRSKRPLVSGTWAEIDDNRGSLTSFLEPLANPRDVFISGATLTQTFGPVPHTIGRLLETRASVKVLMPDVEVTRAGHSEDGPSPPDRASRRLVRVAGAIRNMIDLVPDGLAVRFLRFWPIATVYIADPLGRDGRMMFNPLVPGGYSNPRIAILLEPATHGPAFHAMCGRYYDALATRQPSSESIGRDLWSLAAPNAAVDDLRRAAKRLEAAAGGLEIDRDQRGEST